MNIPEPRSDINPDLDINRIAYLADFIPEGHRIGIAVTVQVMQSLYGGASTGYILLAYESFCAGLVYKRTLQ